MPLGVLPGLPRIVEAASGRAFDFRATVLAVLDIAVPLAIVGGLLTVGAALQLFGVLEGSARVGRARPLRRQKRLAGSGGTEASGGCGGDRSSDIDDLAVVLDATARSRRRRRVACRGLRRDRPAAQPGAAPDYSDESVQARRPSGTQA